MSKEEFPSFDKLLNSNWDYVYSYLLKKTSNKYISEEITIQSFSKAFEKIKTYNPKYNFKTWLISIAKNTYSDYLKKKKLLYKEVNSKKIENIVSELSPEESMINKESYDNLNSKIDELKPMYRDMIKYRYIEDLSIQEISKKLNQPINTTKIKIFRAKKLLSEKLKEND
ncbi:MAG: sigma-70 family RNA polymerase sigma factor [Bacteroidota bacterium]|jgi:RNA polymerase sigma-70 factor (ECF subfamily)|nr:sigma-70 family RNA polymerase sigma factor [Bacteroidota bacterium]|tara:strand:+ start:2463 stop:2972 length:510 start_codon:yes stop_codon:yes gene_type:complete